MPEVSGSETGSASAESTAPAFVAADSDFVLGRAALAEITDPTTVGVPMGSLDEGDGVTSVFFRADMLGYPGWRWTVTIAHLEGEEPTVLETELTPGEGALLAPDWVPWVDRMADYRAAQDAEGSDDSDDGDSDDDSDDDESADDDESDDDSDDDESDDDDDDDDDESDDDAPGIALLHSGDLDGVDIDSLDDESDDDESDDDESDDDESDDDESDDDDVSPDEEPLTLER